MTAQTRERMAVVETGGGRGQYDQPYDWAIIDHPRHGRLYLAEAYGGEQTLMGGAPRWGVAVRLRPDDAAERLFGDDPTGRSVSIIQTALAGHDDERPLLWHWDRAYIARLARAAGLVG